MMSNYSTVMNDKPKMMNNQTKMYACPMHTDEMSTNENECSKSGMKMAKTTERKYNHSVKGSQAAVKL
jgi:hypothetical protein